MQRRRVIAAAAFVAAEMILAHSVLGSAPDKLSGYAYEDTRRLVALVEQAAKLMEQKGESAFSEFGRKGSKWFSDPYYLFVYEPDGTCVFHPVQSDWVGKNMSELRDMNGKPMVQLVAQVGEKPGKDASDWVFYLWPDKTQLIPQWKSAYVRKVVTPSGKTYVIGSGVYDIKMEKAFVEERVRMACDLLETQGKDAAFRELRDPASPFVFLGTFILCEKINGAQWSRPDIRRIGDGLMADAIAVTASGVFGGVASDTSASNVALSNATGATSRWIGFGAGGLFILLGFSPKLGAVLSIMPTPVMGAIVVFVASFMIMSGLQIILGSEPDTRKTFVIGIPLIFGLSLQALPEMYAQVVPWLRPLFGSALTLATVLAVALNLLLRVRDTSGERAPAIRSEG